MNYEIITFYRFKKLSGLCWLKESLLAAMNEHSILGTIIIAEEGFNSTVCGQPADIARFRSTAEGLFGAKFEIRSSFHKEMVFKRRKVKIRPELIALGRSVEIEQGKSTKVNCLDWNKIIRDSETIVLDVRNDYEFRIGTFPGAVSPQTLSFKELPEFVEKCLDPNEFKRVAMFCTGGIRCEKFAPYLSRQGFAEIYQLDGGILRYLEDIGEQENLWQGECFVFDDRVSVDKKLDVGSATDHSPAAKSERRND